MVGDNKIFFVGLASVCFFCHCTADEVVYTELKGSTFGTYYSIKYKSAENLQVEIDSLFIHYSAAVSKYDTASEISEFNRRGKVVFRSPYLKSLVEKAKEIYILTQGALDPTVMPLVDGWGFGADKTRTLSDSAAVDSLLARVDFEAVQWNDTILYTIRPGVLLDLNAVGEGYGIDLIGEWLEGKGIHDYKVEIGGEVLCKGTNPEGKPWRIGIENPKFDQEGERPLLSVVTLENEALGTSGSYRNFFVDEHGQKRSHIIDPRTGYPVQHHLLSATVKANTCILADGLATSCMVLGLEESKKLVETLAQVEAFLVYEEEGILKSWHSRKFITEN